MCQKEWKAINLTCNSFNKDFYIRCLACTYRSPVNVYCVYINDCNVAQSVSELSSTPCGVVLGIKAKSTSNLIWLLCFIFYRAPTRDLQLQFNTHDG